MFGGLPMLHVPIYIAIFSGALTVMAGKVEPWKVFYLTQIPRSLDDIHPLPITENKRPSHHIHALNSLSPVYIMAEQWS